MDDFIIYATDDYSLEAILYEQEMSCDEFDYSIGCEDVEDVDNLWSQLDDIYDAYN